MEGTRGIWQVGVLLTASGAVFGLYGSGAPTNGTSGTGNGLAGPGSVYIRTSNGNQYINTNTKASPTWTLVGTVGAGSIASTQLDPTTIQSVQLTLTNAQIKAIRATPIQIVAAPGAGKFILPIACYAELIYGGTNAFTQGGAGDNLSLKWQDGTTSSIMSGANGAFVQGTASAFSKFVDAVAAGSTISVPKANVDNKALVLHNPAAAEITGNAAANNTIAVTLQYAVQVST